MQNMQEFKQKHGMKTEKQIQYMIQYLAILRLTAMQTVHEQGTKYKIGKNGYNR